MKFKYCLIMLAVFALGLTGCTKKSPIPGADVGRLEAERAIVMAQSELTDARNAGADVGEAEAALGLARNYFNEERYRQSIDEATRAYNLARAAKEGTAAGVRAREDASAAIERAERLIEEARGLGGDVSYPESILSSAKSAFSDADYPMAIEYADRSASEANALLSNLRGDRYTVGTWEADRDCLWNIAARRSIYNDPWKWKRIYQANQEQITDPDLIFPGQTLIIPRD